MEKLMELKAFISQALQDIVGAVDDAQKHIAYGEIVPNRNGKDAKGDEVKTGEVEIEFELTVKSEEGKLVVISSAVGGGAKPPTGGTPAPGGPPPPQPGKLKFKVPVKLPEEKWYHLFYRWKNEAMGCVPSRGDTKKKDTPPDEKKAQDPDAPKQRQADRTEQNSDARQ